MSLQTTCKTFPSSRHYHCPCSPRRVPLIMDHERRPPLPHQLHWGCRSSQEALHIQNCPHAQPRLYFYPNYVDGGFFIFQIRSLVLVRLVPDNHGLPPDGVIVGNTRCNLAGSDLNRQYKHTVKEAFPTVFHVKEMINKLREDDVRVMLYCDLHAHSRQPR